MNIATEIVQFKIQNGIAKEDFLAVVDTLEKNFHSKQAGFIDTEILYNEKNDEWIMIQHWQSIAEMNAASKAMFKNESALTFVHWVISGSVKMTALSQLKSWKK